MEKLTNSQKSIWVTEQFYRGSSVNTICGSAIIDEKIDFENLEKSIQIVCKKHDNFKLRLKIKDGEVYQDIVEENTYVETIKVTDEKEFENFRNRTIKVPIDLNSQLFKFYIFEFENGKGAFMLNIHHLISDGWTLALICNDIIKTYSALINNQEIETKAIYSYIDYINSEKEYLNSEKYEKDKKYWKEKYKTIPEIATIPGSKKEENKLNSVIGERKQFEINKEQVDKLKKYCKENGISLYNFFMAVYAIYLSEISNLDDFVIGTPILNRTNFKEKNAAGMFINMAPLRINLSGVKTFKEFVQNISIESLGMLKHQKYSYQSLLEELRKDNKNMPSLYNILISYQITNAQTQEGNIKYKTEWTFNGCCAENMDIQIYDLNDTGNLNIAYDYKVSIYEGSDIEKLHKRIVNIITQVIQHDDIEIKNIEIVTPKEKQRLLFEFNNTELEYDKTKPIIKYFEEQVEKTPDNIAIVFENKEMTYRELNERANSLAEKLREEGIKNNSIVGIMYQRSCEVLVAILAVLKAGGAYIPIAPDYPDDRIEYMLKDSNVKILLTEKQYIKRISTIPKSIDINLNNKDIYSKNKKNKKNISKPEDLAYLIYTSGSTGTPKGVMLKQQNLSNFHNAMKEKIEYLADGKAHKIISVTTISFDIFEFETLISLTNGLTVYMTNENEQKITAKLEKIIKDNNIDIMQTTPSIMKFHLDNLTNKKDPRSLRYLMLAGEPLSKTLVNSIQKQLPELTIYNGYGPSETTIFSTVENVTNQQQITIGNPIANTQIYILNKNQKVLPRGTVGELYISGDGVGKGYINKEEQTKNSYFPNPFIKDKIMYKTGDLGFFNSNGKIICCGRIDHQVKIRGLRIELSEIENILHTVYNIENVIVVKKQINGKDALCAYYVQKGPVDEAVLKKILQNKLPQYMIPQYFIRLKSMPYTPNGKIDRKALLEPIEKGENKEITKPRNEIDEELIKLIKNMLHYEDVSITDTLLDLGGDSLTGITLSTKILSKYNVLINIKDILTNFTIKDMSDFITENKEDGKIKIKIPRIPEAEYYQLSSAQRRIYYNSKMIGEDNIVYNMPGAVMINGLLEEERVKEALNKIIERHEILRTRFIINDNTIMQKVIENIKIDVPVFYNKSDEIYNILKSFSKPFNLEEDLLIRAEIHYIDNKKTLLLFDSHHIIMDGTGLNNLIIEFNRIYNGDNLKKLPIQYRDYSDWEQKFNESEKIKKLENYWVNKFNGSDFEQLNLPYDYKQPTNRTYRGETVSKIIDEKIYRKVERFAKRNGVSPYILFLTAFFILLYKYTGQNDINIGSPMANRNLNETKRMIGMFVNNIVIRGKVDSNKTFKEFLDQIKDQVLDDLSYQPYPFDLLLKKLNIPTDPSRNPLFDVMLTYQNREERTIKIDDKESEIIELNNHIAKFNLSVEIKPETHTVNIEYCTDLFKKQTIERFFDHYVNVIKTIINDVDTRIKDINIMSDKEKNKIVYKFNRTNKFYPKNKTVGTLFEKQVRKHLNKKAAIFGDNSLTYKELNERANQLAHYLRNLGIKPNDKVGIMLPRSLELISSILAVVKSGACFIPIDPTYPSNRIEHMLNNSEAKLLITNKYLSIKEYHQNQVLVDYDNLDIYDDFNKENLKCINNSEDLVYVIYTSGSTGEPKGVEIKHKNLCNFITGIKDVIDFNSNKVMISVTTICFDIFELEIWGALTSGQTMVIASEEEQNIPQKLNKLCLKYNVDMIQTTPARYSLLLEDKENLEFFNNLKDILVGGEQFTENLLLELKQYTNAQIFNMYGPTETTIWSTVKDLTKETAITIGRPISNTQVYVLDKDLKPVPIGITGELYIAGDGVGRGYLKNPQATKEKYIQNPFIEGSIMYKTGDVCKFNKLGELICLGRIDNQVKIRGLRIELDEIEKRILEYPFINKAKVVKQMIGNREIISAYYIAKRRIRISELRNHLKRYLPNYMIPSYFTALNDFPYTPNGKIDKKALPIPDKLLKSEETKYEKPKSDLEKKLVEIWEDILNTKPIGIKDNFFELGGDSILAMNLNIKLLKITDKINYSDIFSYPTISELAQKIENDIINKKEDFSNLNIKYKKILDNNMNIPITIKYQSMGNVLLTGATGFLGMHIMDNFLKNEKGKIYVLVREEPGMSLRDKLLNKMHYYFGNKYDQYLEDRIIIVKGDLTEDGFGLKQEELFKLGNSINTILNSAAKVSHYGNYQEFYNINVKSVEKITNFAKTFNKKVFHISTISVSGNAFASRESFENNKIEDKKEFCENNFYINQNLDNVYVRSKFEAEKIMLDAIYNGLDGYILRMGNLMPRIADGKFQDNINENAYINRLKVFKYLGCIPDYLSDEYLEFTPVDKAAESIIKIIQFTNNNNRIYHIYNNKYILLKEILKIMYEENINIQILENNEFKKKIENILNSNNSDMLGPIINELDKNLNLNYYSKIIVNSNHTIELLEKYGFKWPKIDKKYILNILKLIKGE